MNYRICYTLEEARDWDWSLNNAELARLHNITRERVRQIRKELGLPLPKIRGNKERHIVETVEKLKENHSEITVDAIQSILKDVSEPYLRIVLGKHKIQYIHGNRKYPWEKINWNLPNITISDIWGIPYPDVVEFRNRKNEGDALWERDSNDERFIQAVSEEQIKAGNQCMEIA